MPPLFDLLAPLWLYIITTRARRPLATWRRGIISPLVDKYLPTRDGARRHLLPPEKHGSGGLQTSLSLTRRTINNKNGIAYEERVFCRSSFDFFFVTKAGLYMFYVGVIHVTLCRRRYSKSKK